MLVVKNLPANAGDIRDMGSISGLGTSPFFPGKNDRVGCHFLLQGGLPDPGIEPMSLMSPALAGRFFTTSTTWEALSQIYTLKSIDYLIWGHSCSSPVNYGYRTTASVTGLKLEQIPLEAMWTEEALWHLYDVI